MVKTFILVAVMAIFGAALLRAARWVLDFLLVLLAAACGGTVVGRLVTTDTASQTAAGILAFIVLALSLWRLRAWFRRDRAMGELWRSKLARTSLKRPWPQEAPEPETSQVRISPWTRLLDAVPECRSRLAVAERTFARFRCQHAERAFDPATHETLIMVERRLPQLIEAELDTLSSLAPLQRREALSALVDLVEDLAADCERQISTADRMGETASVVRLHIQRYLDGRRSSTL